LTTFSGVPKVSSGWSIAFLDLYCPDIYAHLYIRVFFNAFVAFILHSSSAGMNGARAGVRQLGNFKVATLRRAG
jgi:hypothetical protein